MAKKQAQEVEVQIEQLHTGRLELWIEGTTPLIVHAMSAKVMRELLFPKGRKSAASKAQTLKHDPIEEFRDACYVRPGKGPTRLVCPASWFKASLCNAALEVPGAKKAQIGRLVWIEGDKIDLYGVPKLFMAVTRSADMNKTPDVRTRPILPEWACKITIRFVMPTLNEVSITRLMETAGLVMGVGDMRQQKGAGSYGQFHVADGEPKAITKAGGLAAQDAALKNPECYDEESAKLLEWFLEERKRRGK